MAIPVATDTDTIPLCDVAADFESLFPLDHNISTLGFVSTYFRFYGDGERTVCCWAIQASDAELDRIVLVARGVVDTSNSNILRVSDSSSSADLSLKLECKSGKQFLALLPYPAVPSGVVHELQFIEHDEESPLRGTDASLTAFETPCRQSEDEACILDERERQILWVPPVNRGHGLWLGRQLVIEGGSGRLTVIDFPNAVTGDSVLF